MYDTKEIGRRIKELRRESNLTQDQLAKACGLTVRTIGSIERGEKNNIRLATLVSLCNGLDVMPNDILLHC